jgi:hypothetical protein
MIFDLEAEKQYIYDHCSSRLPYQINLDNPQTFCEKIQWTKLYGITPLRRKVTDKLQARDYIASRIGSEYLPDMYWSGDNVDDILWNSLPSQFVVKPTHSSHQYMIVTDKNKIDFEKAKETFQEWLDHDYYTQWHEINYKDLQRRLMIEEYLNDGTHHVPIDYKLYVFNGVVKFGLVVMNRGKSNYSRFFVNENFEKQNLRVGKPPMTYGTVFKPNTWEQMKDIAVLLGGDFDFMRVDLYSINNRIYVGELTNTPDNGSRAFDPPEYDSLLGSYWDLNHDGKGNRIYREKDISIIIPISNTMEAERKRNLDYLQKRCSILFPAAEIIVETDNSGNEDYCKGRAINNAAKRASREVLLIADADVVFTQEQILNSLPFLNDYAWVLPYTYLYKINQTMSNIVVKYPIDDNLPSLSTEAFLTILTRQNPRNGALQLLTKESFNAVGGYDERFVGWGDEDVAFCCALQSIVGKGYCYNDKIYHLWHPQQSSYKPHKMRTQDKNYKLRQYYEGFINKPKEMQKLLNYQQQKLDIYAEQYHYFEHMLPIWKKLPEPFRGKFYVHEDILEATQEYDTLLYEQNDNCLLIPSFFGKPPKPRKRIILMNHGAGQSFIMPHKNNQRSGAGGPGKENVVLFLDPNEKASSLNKQAYPNAKHAIIGCPKMDKWHQRFLMGDIKKREGNPVIAISFHFNRQAAPESKSAWPHYISSLPMLAYKNMSKEWKVIGHGHPRMIETLRPYYEENGIEVIDSFEDIMEQADLYICDHMSTLYEFASTGRPVVVLNAPWYRRHIEHGLRFWEFADVGINVNTPGDMEKAIYEALEDTLEQKMKRERAVAAVYKYRDGMCTQRTVDVIVSFLRSFRFTPFSYSRELRSSNKNNRIKKRRALKDKWYGRR